MGTGLGIRRSVVDAGTSKRILTGGSTRTDADSLKSQRASSASNRPSCLKSQIGKIHVDLRSAVGFCFLAICYLLNCFFATASHPNCSHSREQPHCGSSRELPKDVPALGGEDRRHRRVVADYLQHGLNHLPGEQSEHSVEDCCP